MNTAALIFFLSFLCFFVREGKGQNECVDCSSIIDQNCVVKTTGVGYLAKAPRDKLLIAKLEPGEKPDPDLKECMNPGYKLLGKLSTFLCFWSPKLKCQALAEKSYVDLDIGNTKARVCAACASYCGCDFSKGFSRATENMPILSIYLALLITLLITYVI